MPGFSERVCGIFVYLRKAVMVAVMHKYFGDGCKVPCAPTEKTLAMTRGQDLNLAWEDRTPSLRGQQSGRQCRDGRKLPYLGDYWPEDL